jgi:hypothetical protein
MVSGIPPVGITQNELFLNCDTVLIGVRHICDVAEKVKSNETEVL